jgi:uncharacterized protein YciI
MSASDVQKKSKKMLNYQLFVIFWHGKGRDLMPHLGEHLDYLIVLERDGKVFASGPLGPRERGDGMTIVRAKDEAEARQMAMGDPFVVRGIREFTIEPWVIMEGSINIQVSYSDVSVSVR